MNWTPFLVFGDNHGDMVDLNAVAKLRAFSKIWKPKITVHIGDCFDMRPLRRGASEDERRESMGADFKAGMALLEEFRPQFFLQGNHSFRLWNLRDNGSGVAADLAAELIRQIEHRLGRMGTKILPYHKREGILKLGHLKVLHGFHSGIFATRQCALVYGTSLMGHIHCSDEHAIPGLERRVCRSIGALCNLDAEYNSRTTLSLRQCHGFGYGVLRKSTGDFHLWTAEDVNGSWVVPSDIVQL